LAVDGRPANLLALDALFAPGVSAALSK